MRAWRRRRRRRHAELSGVYWKALRLSSGADFDRLRLLYLELVMCPDPRHCDHVR